MTQIYLALGSNLGDRLAHLQAAVRELGQLVELSQASAVYESLAAYVEDQPTFYNAVICGNTARTAQDILQALQALERNLGRRKGQRYGPRVIDLDLLLYGEQQITTADLIIPHPRMHERDFVLRPLADLAPNMLIPGLATDVQTLLRSATHGGVITKIAEPASLFTNQVTG